MFLTGIFPQTFGGLLNDPQRPLHVMAKRISSFLRQLARGTLLGLHHIQVGHPLYFCQKSLLICICISSSIPSMGIAAFITEISTPEQRTFLLAMIHFVSRLGSPIGTKVDPFPSNHVLTKSSDWSSSVGRQGRGSSIHVQLYIFGAGLGGKLVTLIFLVARLEMFKVSFCCA